MLPSPHNNPQNEFHTQRKKQFRSLIFGGLLPVIGYTIVEEVFGIFLGLIAGMALAIGEIFWEWKTRKKVDAITWTGGAILLSLGVVSLLTHEGIWFKLQPALLEALVGFGLLISALMGKPFLVLIAKKQNLFANIRPDFHEAMEEAFKSMTFRIGLFFLVHMGLAIWAALLWSTRAWALLKGVGFTGSFILYMLVEMVLMRKKLRQNLQRKDPAALNL